MPTKPTVKPRWAEDDVVDPTSGENNVDEPSPEKKDKGWDRHEKPERQFFNWLARFYYRWIDWFDGTTIPLTLTGATTNNQPTDGTGHTHAVTTSDATTSTSTTQIANSKAVNDARVAAIAAAQAELYSEVGPIALDGDFTNGSIYCTKVGNIVTITSDDLITSALLPTPSSLAGIVPADYRPTYFISNTTFIGSDAEAVTILPDGSINVRVRDMSTGSAASNSNWNQFSITYAITADVV